MKQLFGKLYFDSYTLSIFPAIEIRKLDIAGKMVERFDIIKNKKASYESVT